MNNIGVTSLDLLQLALIILKLCKVISWSWLWVLSPMWGMTIIVIATILILKIKKRFDRKNHMFNQQNAEGKKSNVILK